MKIGLTGSIACGKSTVSSFLREKGYTVIDADAISHALTAPGGDALPAIRETFGDAVFDGEVLNRRALGSIVFTSAEKRAQLNAILHPMIISAIEQELAAQDTPDSLVIGDVPLLYECSMAHMFDRVWVVSVPREVQLDRICMRDGLSQEEAAKRIDAQMPLKEKCALADAVIDTNGPIENTRRQVDALIQSIFPRRKA
ncbi:MAG: dephospho-CoA kinase [Clostridia bacterium]|nr:dephospho-CoA kinase [Clostridia bacterium]